MPRVGIGAADAPLCGSAVLPNSAYITAIHATFSNSVPAIGIEWGVLAWLVPALSCEADKPCTLHPADLAAQASRHHRKASRHHRNSVARYRNGIIARARNGSRRKVRRIRN